mmetsp:Transcript_33281/g.56581  ORF Transcript_33281/g.56581 Transcript_33281/m.56581 type:complete len:174 (+) Transcript_33281:1421-1942(+)
MSAHLSRQRKKLYITDLKSENALLRRKEQILLSIPDLIVVFDASGTMSLVSRSVSRFLKCALRDMERSSFWEWLSDNSVRKVKSAFMDALAVKRRGREDSTPLWGGRSMMVELLVHHDPQQQKQGEREGNQQQQQQEEVKTESPLMVSLKGVVHFAGELPECVCSIRHKEGGT